MLIGCRNSQFFVDFSHHFSSPMENLHHFGGLLNWKKKRRKKSQTRAFVEVKPNGCVKVSLENCVHRPPAERSRDIVVVGAGVAGAALAYALGKDGRKVHVIERDLREPNRIVGELLQPGGYLKLIELGIEDCVEEIGAQKVFGYALYKDGKNTKLAYPLENFDSHVSGRSFHHGRFIQRLREKAASLPKLKFLHALLA